MQAGIDSPGTADDGYIISVDGWPLPAVLGIVPSGGTMTAFAIYRPTTAETPAPSVHPHWGGVSAGRTGYRASKPGFAVVMS